MSLFVVKVKDKELYFNADEGNGEFVCNTPMVMDETQANDVLKYCSELYDIETDDMYHISDMEVREIKLQLI